MALLAMDVISNHCLETRWIKVDAGLRKGLPEGRRVHAGKPALFLGFQFHFVKEKNCTQGTEVNKGHHSDAAVRAACHFSYGRESRQPGNLS